MAKTQNPSVPDSFFDGFPIPSVHDFVDGDRDEILLNPEHSQREFVTHPLHPACPHLFISMGKLQKCVFQTLTVSGFARSFVKLMRGILPPFYCFRPRHMRLSDLVSHFSLEGIFAVWHVLKAVRGSLSPPSPTLT